MPMLRPLDRPSGTSAVTSRLQAAADSSHCGWAAADRRLQAAVEKFAILDASTQRPAVTVYNSTPGVCRTVPVQAAAGASCQFIPHSFQQQPCWCDALPFNSRRAHVSRCTAQPPVRHLCQSQRRGLGARTSVESARNSPRGRTPSRRTSIVARIVYCWFVALVFAACALMCSDPSPLSTPSAHLMQKTDCSLKAFPAQHACVDGTGSGASACYVGICSCSGCSGELHSSCAVRRRVVIDRVKRWAGCEHLSDAGQWKATRIVEAGRAGERSVLSKRLHLCVVTRLLQKTRCGIGMHV